MPGRELQIGKTTNEFPGGTFNWLIREVKWLRANMLPRKRGGGGSGGGFQIVRGSTVVAVNPSDLAFQIEGVTAYEEHAATPSDPLWVAATGGGVTLSEGDFVWAIYRKGVLTFNPGGGDVVVDWLMLDFGASATPPPLRAFELTANKTLSSAIATAKFLDLDGNLVGSNVTLNDPEHRFSGRIADNLCAGSEGFRGYAILRTDLAAEDPDQYDIVVMDQLYEFIKAEIVKISNYPSAGVTVVARYSQAINAVGYDQHAPAGVDSAIGYLVDAEIFNVDDYLEDPEPGPSAESDPQPVLMQLVDPDASPPTYRVYEVKPAGQEDRKVASSVLDTVPATLIEKLDNVATYDDETDRLVEFEEFDDAGTRKVRGFLDVTDLGGGGFTAVAGCGVDITGTTTKTFTFDYDIINQYAGLAINFNAAPCPLIENAMKLSVGVVRSEFGVSRAGGYDGNGNPVQEFRPQVIDPGFGIVREYTLDQLTGEFNNDVDMPGPANPTNWKRHNIPDGSRCLVVRDWYLSDWIVGDDYLAFARLGIVVDDIDASTWDADTNEIINEAGSVQVYREGEEFGFGNNIFNAFVTVDVSNPGGRIYADEPVILFDQQNGNPLAIPLGGDLLTVLIDGTIPAATWSGTVLTPGIRDCNVLMFDGEGAVAGNTSYSVDPIVGRPMEISIENHDFDDFAVDSGDKYIGMATRNRWGHYVLHTVTCKKVPD